MEDLEFAHLLVEATLDKKGDNIVLLDLREQTSLTDYFLICSSDNPRQLDALLEAVTLNAKTKTGQLPWGVEGDSGSGWVLVDFGSVIVHLFHQVQRDYYDLEELWKEAAVILRAQ